MKENKVCLSDCNVTSIILKYLVPIFQYLSVEMKDYNMKLKTTKCLNTAVMLVYILGSQKDIDTKVDYCDTENINKRYAKIKDEKKKVERKEKILNKLEKDIINPKIKDRYFYYILMTHTTMYNKKNEKGWFPGHVFIVEKSKNCKSKLRYKIFQSYINQYDLNGHYKRNNESMDVENHNIKPIINGMKNILLKKTWNKRAVKFWKKLCYIDTSDILGYDTKDINFCYEKIKIENCYKNLLKFTKKALKNIEDNINNGNLDYYNVDQQDNDVKVKELDIHELYEKFYKLHEEL
tara:strand:+ start:3556 stop:4434 length:879 start_codon:yes stop_codon:yes gene_type:complete